ncbi:MAG: putative Fe-S cluster assembly protein SufT [Candidatus Omnitrophica bacterium]|nr:putative Fe-S cluster assembly protein SufT [Candidatus Omnitrophota bacterium]
METKESIFLARDCEAIEIPNGHKITLFKGTHVSLTQSLGGVFTVVTDQGTMARIGGKDADALGKEIPQEAKAARPHGPEESIEQQVWEKLRNCYDPEIPYNVVDLGLIYECRTVPRPEGGYDVFIKMTLTSPGCFMGDWIAADMKDKIRSIPDVRDVRVEIVFDPPWNPSKMSAALRRALNIF